jgi:hypothetical protein
MSCTSLNSFKWIDNCCYIDSVIIALFATNIKFIQDIIIYKDVKPRQMRFSCVPKSYRYRSVADKSYIDFEIRKKIQDKLRLMYDYIKNNKDYSNIKLTCNDLRDTIVLCPTDDQYYLKTMGDSSDFLKYILSLFKSRVLKINKTIYGTDNIDAINPRNLRKIYDYVENDSIVQDINSDILIKNKKYKIDKFLDFREDVYDEKIKSRKFERTIMSKKIIDAPMIIFNFYILYQDEETFKEHFYKINIIPTKNIKIDDFKFNLCSIIIYKNMHYTCYFMCANEWYYYDDTSDQTIKFIGEYNDLLKHKPSPIKNGILYFYNKV